MRDLIDERDYRERSSRSIIKGYNVHYITPDELAEQEKQKMQEDQTQTGLEQAGEPVSEEEVPVMPESGEEAADPVTQEQIAKILNEREEERRQMIEEYQE